MNAATEPNNVDDLKKWAQLHYILHLVGLVFSAGTLTFIVVILNYLKRKDAEGTFVRSHMDHMISSWWSSTIWSSLLVLVIIGCVFLGFSGKVDIALAVGALAALGILITYIIFAVRMISGLNKLSKNVEV